MGLRLVRIVLELDVVKTSFYVIAESSTFVEAVLYVLYLICPQMDIGFDSKTVQQQVPFLQNITSII